MREYKKLLSYLILFLTVILFIFQKPVLAESTRIQSGSNLQEVIHKAQEGESIFIEKGLYEGPITIDKSLTLVGEEGTLITGNSEGNVVTITADDVLISNLVIENSGESLEDSGVYLDKVENVKVENSEIRKVQNGIYIKSGLNNEIIHNKISSNEGHFSQRGNGIHIFKGTGNTVKNNEIKYVQDGIYFDFAKNVKVIKNTIRDSRYGMHFMFSEDIDIVGNSTVENITGLMIMDSARLNFKENVIHHQFHFRGFGVLIYDSQEIVLSRNEITQNSVGISFEKARGTEVIQNIIAANQVGLGFRTGNEKNTFFENNFIANIVSSKIGKEKLNLDNGVKGNYWDDYGSYDITGDGIGELPYKAGSLYDNLLKIQPLWQFYFESPAIQTWSKAESMFPSLGTVKVYDYKPLVKPVNLTTTEVEMGNEQGVLPLLIAMLLIGISVFIIVKGRSYI